MPDPKNSTDNPFTTPTMTQILTTTANLSTGPSMRGHQREAIQKYAQVLTYLRSRFLGKGPQTLPSDEFASDFEISTRVHQMLIRLGLLEIVEKSKGTVTYAATERLRHAIPEDLTDARKVLSDPARALRAQAAIDARFHPATETAPAPTVAPVESASIIRNTTSAEQRYEGVLTYLRNLTASGTPQPLDGKTFARTFQISNSLLPALMKLGILVKAGNDRRITCFVAGSGLAVVTAWDLRSVRTLAENPEQMEALRVDLLSRPQPTTAPVAPETVPVMAVSPAEAREEESERVTDFERYARVIAFLKELFAGTAPYAFRNEDLCARFAVSNSLRRGLIMIGALKRTARLPGGIDQYEPTPLFAHLTPHDLVGMKDLVESPDTQADVRRILERRAAGESVASLRIADDRFPKVLRRQTGPRVFQGRGPVVHPIEPAPYVAPDREIPRVAAKLVETAPVATTTEVPPVTPVPVAGPKPAYAPSVLLAGLLRAFLEARVRKSVYDELILSSAQKASKAFLAEPSDLALAGLRRGDYLDHLAEGQRLEQLVNFARAEAQEQARLEIVEGEAWPEWMVTLFK